MNAMDKKKVKRILVTRTGYFGDMLLFVPTLRELKRNFPQAHIALMVQSRLGQEVIKNCPYVDEFIVKDYGSLAEKIGFLLSLRRKRFDLILASTQEVGFALNAFVIGAPTRIGFKEAHDNAQHFKENLPFLYSQALSSPPENHEVETNLDLVRAAGGRVESTKLEFWPDKKDRAKVESLLKKLKGKGPLIGIHPFLREKKKNWSREKWVEVIKTLRKRFKARIVMGIGLPEEMPENRAIIQALDFKPFNLEAGLSIQELAALLEKMDLFVCLDSGPMHLAAAVNTPLIALMGPSDFPQYRPWSKKACVLRKDFGCSPCDFHQTCREKKCLKEIKPEEVVRAAEKMLAKGGRP